MIALIAAAALQTATVVEWLDPSWNVVSIQAVVKLPPHSRHERLLLEMVAASLGSETRSYGGSQIADLASRAGSRLRATVMDDHIRVGMDVVPADESTAVGMLGSVLRESVITASLLDDAGQQRQFRRSGYWRQALESGAFVTPKYTQSELDSLLARVFRPENVTLAVGGKLTPGLSTGRWEDIRSAWTISKPPTSRALADPDRPVSELASQVSVIDFQGAAFSGSDAALATRLLALTAIGTGKASSLWRVARDGMGISYRQEAVLYPHTNGFQPRFLIVHNGREGLSGIAGKIRDGLLADIAAWTESDRKRAIGMADYYLVRGGDMSPLYFTPGRPVDGDLADQTFMRAYWPMKTGTAWNPHQLVGRMGFVELSDLKAMASKMVEDAKLVIHRGR